MLLAIHVLICFPLINLILGHAQQADCKLSDDDGVQVENAALLQTKSIVAHEGEDGHKDQVKYSLIKSGLTQKDVDGLQDQASQKIPFHMYTQSTGLQGATLYVGNQTGAAMDVRKSGSASVQWQVLIYTTVLLLLLSAVLTELFYRRRHAPISMAALSCLFFGMDNFFIAYAGAYLRSPHAHMALMFLFIGVIAITLHVPLALYSYTYKAQLWDMLSSSKLMLACIALTAIFVDGAEVCGNRGFSLNLPESGPYQALASCNVLIVCPFFYYFYGEILTLLQLLGTALLIIGTTFLADVLNWSSNSISLYGFMWIMFSMLLYSFSDITLRVSSIGGLAWQPRVMFMLLVMGLIGFPMYFIDLKEDTFAEYYETPTLLVWPFLNAVAGVLGLLSCTIAFEAPDAPCGVLTAIVNSNSAVLVILNRFILGYSPSASKLLGMGFIMAGIALFHLTYNSEGEKGEHAESCEQKPKSCES